MVECKDDFEGFCIRRPLLIAIPNGVNLYNGLPLEWIASGADFSSTPLDESTVLVRVQADWGQETYEMHKRDGLLSRRVLPIIDRKEMPEEHWFVCKGSFDPIDILD